MQRELSSFDFINKCLNKKKREKGIQKKALETNFD